MPSKNVGFAHHCFKNRVGQKRGMLEVVSFAGSRPGHNGYPVYLWLCHCDCGREVIKPWAYLLRGTKSCGCAVKSRSSEIIRSYNALGLPNPTITHGMTGSPTYISWQAMKSRCGNPKNREYVRYGGRGITVCGRWRDSFELFLEDMGPRPTSSHSIDRINCNGSYEPGNCRWATSKEQARNTRNTRYITLSGQTKSLAEWCEVSGLRAFTILYRIDAGWDDEAILNTPPWKKARKSHGKKTVP
jgi:hypothetical protein